MQEHNHNSKESKTEGKAPRTALKDITNKKFISCIFTMDAEDRSSVDVEAHPDFLEKGFRGHPIPSIPSTDGSKLSIVETDGLNREFAAMESVLKTTVTMGGVITDQISQISILKQKIRHLTKQNSDQERRMQDLEDRVEELYSKLLGTTFKKREEDKEEEEEEEDKADGEESTSRLFKMQTCIKDLRSKFLLK